MRVLDDLVSVDKPGRLGHSEGMRRASSRILIAFILVASTVLAFGNPASACSCEGGSITDNSSYVDAVFVGSQTDRSGNDITFEVESVYHGEVGERITVYTADDGGACGTSFDDGVTTTVLVTDWEGRREVSLCSQLLTITDGELEALYGQAAAPLPIDQSRSSSSFPMGWTLIGIGVVAAGAIVWRIGRNPTGPSGDEFRSI